AQHTVLHGAARQAALLANRRIVADFEEVVSQAVVGRQVHVRTYSGSHQPVEETQQGRTGQVVDRDRGGDRLDEPPTKEIPAPKRIVTRLVAADHDPFGG